MLPNIIVGSIFFLIPVSRATAPRVRCLPPQSPAPPVPDDLHHRPRPALALTSPTPRLCVAHTPPSAKMRTSGAAQRPWDGASPAGKPRRGMNAKQATRPCTRPHLDAIPLSRSLPPKRTTTAQTPPVPWRRWPLRRLWPAAWDAQTPSARLARACGLAGRSPTDIFESAWRRQPPLRAAILSATQRRTTGARDKRHSMRGGVRGLCVQSRGQCDSFSISAPRPRALLMFGKMWTQIERNKKEQYFLKL